MIVRALLSIFFISFLISCSSTNAPPTQNNPTITKYPYSGQKGPGTTANTLISPLR